MGKNKKDKQKLTELRYWFLSILMNDQAQVNSSNGGDVDSGLSMVPEGDGDYKKVK
ncbi:hypothetical protein LY01_02766 [Nonlabens xylanidelens]|uniref:Uncharacterized protein n=1 Tax=Nonlabens xylanidelens TaxID=191564 RepID=A0A2S6IFS2_9FLAO|nr:hypothetical protein [Nonlabens xylanidelens]PPK93061.1 hypothetical protein LY01_02766 [Nonlabens xylanidelens]